MRNNDLVFVFLWFISNSSDGIFLTSHSSNNVLILIHTTATTTKC